MAEATVLPFPGKFKPRLAYTEETLDEFMFGSEGQTFLNLPIEPRLEFGLLLRGCGRERTEDRAEIDAFKRNARIERAGRNARDAADGKSHICPTLLIAAAGKGNSIAEQARALAKECHVLGAIVAGNTFASIADFAETAAAQIEAPAHEVE